MYQIYLPICPPLSGKENELFAKLRPVFYFPFISSFRPRYHRHNFSPYNNILLSSFLAQWGFPGPTLLPAASALEQNNTASVCKMGLNGDNDSLYLIKSAHHFI